MKQSKKATNMQLILTEAKDIRKELIAILDQHRTHLWSLITVLILVIGVYVTLALYLLDNNQEIYCSPFSLSIITVLVAVLVSLYSVSPKTLGLIPDNDELYKLTVEKKTRILEDILQTYLIQNKNYEYIIAENSAIRSFIHYLTLLSVIEYILFLGIIIGKTYVNIINTTAVIIFMVCMILLGFYAGYKYKYLRHLKKELNIL